MPYPEPTSAAATKIGKANKRVDTKAEVRLRSALHAMGLRFRKDMLVRAGTVRTHPDIVFTRARVAVFVDGCFWHRCPEHGTIPKSNPNYWIPKLDANVARDQRVTAALEAEGWTVLRIWEHEPVATVLPRVTEATRDSPAVQRRPRSSAQPRSPAPPP